MHSNPMLPIQSPNISLPSPLSSSQTPISMPPIFSPRSSLACARSWFAKQLGTALDQGESCVRLSPLGAEFRNLVVEGLEVKKVKKWEKGERFESGDQGADTEVTDGMTDGRDGMTDERTAAEILEAAEQSVTERGSEQESEHESEQESEQESAEVLTGTAGVAATIAHTMILLPPPSSSSISSSPSSPRQSLATVNNSASSNLRLPPQIASNPLPHVDPSLVPPTSTPLPLSSPPSSPPAPSLFSPTELTALSFAATTGERFEEVLEPDKVEPAKVEPDEKDDELPPIRANDELPPIVRSTSWEKKNAKHRRGSFSSIAGRSSRARARARKKNGSAFL